jgi:hypothetical protein
LLFTDILCDLLIYPAQNVILASGCLEGLYFIMPQALQVLTANRLQLGEVAYWNGSTGWVPHLADAQVFSGADAEAALKAAAEWVSKGEVVAPYLFDVRIEAEAIVPVKVREAIRAAGPSVRRDLGKQAGNVSL